MEWPISTDILLIQQTMHIGERVNKTGDNRPLYHSTSDLSQSALRILIPNAFSNCAFTHADTQPAYIRSTTMRSEYTLAVCQRGIHHDDTKRSPLQFRLRPPT